jgi:hypothetical protein
MSTPSETYHKSDKSRISRLASCVSLPVSRFSILVTLLVSCVLCLVSCELFATREPEPPQLGTGGVFIQPDTPSAVLENLSNSVREMNAINYLNCLSSTDFVFQPAGQGNIGDPALWSGWGRIEEDRYFKNLASAAENLTGHSLSLEIERRDDLSPTEHRVIANYALVVNTNRNTASRVPNRITGQFIIIMRAGASGLWSISNWTDIATNPEYSWTELKAEFIRG